MTDQATQTPLHLFGVELPELRTWFKRHEQPAYRATQVLEWLYQKDVADIAAMTNLSKPLRAWLSENAVTTRSSVTRTSVGSDETQKLLLTWPDGASVEAVWIPDRDRQTACISSQVGCPVGCKFCASGMDGVQRDLTSGEIVEQAWRIRELIRQTLGPDEDEKLPRLNNIVFMGMGEPLANYDAVVGALRILNADWGLNIGARKITVSTVGLPKQIRRLADEGLQINLALSLHAPEDELRRELIPWGKVPIGELLDACGYFFDKTGREITLEYILLDGVNMSQKHATQLATIAKRLRCNVNLLRYNPVPGLAFRRPNAQAAYQFQQELRERGINAHLRKSRGRDVDAACGQLRRRTIEQGPTLAAQEADART